MGTKEAVKQIHTLFMEKVRAGRCHRARKELDTQDERFEHVQGLKGKGRKEKGQGDCRGKREEHGSSQDARHWEKSAPDDKRQDQPRW